MEVGDRAGVDRPDLGRLFRPESIAVVGATDDPTKTGSRIIRNLDAAGFSGPVFPVNPRAEVVAGRPSVATPADLPEPATVAYVLVPAGRVVEAVRQCAERGVAYAVIAAAGFAETPDEEGHRRQEELVEICRRHPIRLVGPNCTGLYNVTDGVPIGFNTAHGWPLRPGPLALLSHSGALFTSLARRSLDHDVGLSKFVSVGNEADLDVLDVFAFLLDDDATRVFGLVVDGISDGERFAELCEAARARGKAVLALRFGESAAGAAAAVAHSSRLAGASRVTNAFLEALGVGRVTSVEALIVAAAMVAAGRGRPPAGVGAWTMSGAAGSILADAAARVGVPLAELGPGTRAALDGHARLARIVNPVDIGAVGDPSRTAEVLDLLAADEGVSDLVGMPHDMGGRPANLATAQALVAAAAAHDRRLVVLVPGGLDGVEDDLRDGGAVIVRDTATAVEALAAARATEVPRSPAPSPRGDRTAAGEGPAWSRPGPPGPLTEPASLDLLGAWGVPVAGWTEVADEQAARAAATRWTPTVVKGVVPGVAHKSELGLVEVGLATPDAVAKAYLSVHQAVEAQGGGRVIVQEMLRGRTELLVGLTRDPALGAFVVVGLGGVFAEELDATVVVPVGAPDGFARERILAAPVGRVLSSHRWAESPLDVVLDVVDRLRALALAAGDDLVSVDVNPLVVGDGWAVAGDALVVLG
ncbi:MAG: acetate--CoA ligase family protein [Acidimicrobiia bacterium]